MCFGYLRWKPRDFWRSNVWEMCYAMEGYMLSKGIKKHDKKTSLTSEDVNEIKKAVERDKKRNDRQRRASSKG